jgi:hypothetical protein
VLAQVVADQIADRGVIIDDQHVRRRQRAHGRTPA